MSHPGASALQVFPGRGFMLYTHTLYYTAGILIINWHNSSILKLGSNKYKHVWTKCWKIPGWMICKEGMAWQRARNQSSVKVCWTLAVWHLSFQISDFYSERKFVKPLELCGFSLQWLVNCDPIFNQVIIINKNARDRQRYTSTHWEWLSDAGVSSTCGREWGQCRGGLCKHKEIVHVEQSEPKTALWPPCRGKGPHYPAALSGCVRSRVIRWNSNWLARPALPVQDMATCPVPRNSFVFSWHHLLRLSGAGRTLISSAVKSQTARLLLHSWQGRGTHVH